eukprot:111184_1
MGNLRWYNNCYLVVLCIAFGLSYFYRNSIAAIADVLEKEFETTATVIGMLSSFVYISFFSMQLVVGLLLEIFSFRILLLLTALFLGISSIAFSFTDNITTGITIRLISGFIASTPFVSAMSMSSQLYGNEYVAFHSGVLTFCGNSFVFIGSYIQAFIYDKYQDWRSVYLFIGIISIICSILFFILNIFEYNGYITNNQKEIEISLHQIHYNS